MAIVGGKSTIQINNENRLVRNVQADVSLLDPNLGPLVTLMTKMGKLKPIDQVFHEWYEDADLDVWGVVSNNTYNSSVTSIVVVDGTLFNAQELWHVPQSGEIFYVTAVSTNTLTIVRGVAGSTAASIPANENLRRVGSAIEEGGQYRQPRSTSKVQKTTYIQEFSEAVELSDTAKNVRTYATADKGEKSYEHQQALRRLKRDMNSALLFGRPSQNMTGGINSQPLRTTMGVIPIISTNVMDIATTGTGILTYKSFLEFLAMPGRYGDKEKKVLLAPSLLMQAVGHWQHNRVQVTPPSATLGVTTQTIVLPTGGTAMLIFDRALENPRTAYTGYANTALLLDFDEFEGFYLKGKEGSFEPRLYENITPNGYHKQVDEYHAKIMYKIRQEKYHALLKGFTSYQA